jgi:hypothetical protein
MMIGSLCKKQQAFVHGCQLEQSQWQMDLSVLDDVFGGARRPGQKSSNLAGYPLLLALVKTCPP